jgi:hypothetical protein
MRNNMHSKMCGTAQKERPPTAAVIPKSDQELCLDGGESLPLPAPAAQT